MNLRPRIHPRPDVHAQMDMVQDGKKLYCLICAPDYGELVQAYGKPCCVCRSVWREGSWHPKKPKTTRRGARGRFEKHPNW